MCKVYNTVGALNEVKVRLNQQGIPFESLDELLSFQRGYNEARQKILLDARTQLLQEKTNLGNEVRFYQAGIQNIQQREQEDLQARINNARKSHYTQSDSPTTILARISGRLRNAATLIHTTYLRVQSGAVLYLQLKPLKALLEAKRRRYNLLSKDFEKVVSNISGPELRKLDRKKSVIDQIAPFIYGAIGEEKVAKELERLSDDHILINNLSLSFKRAIYHKHTAEYIKSAQIDHLLIAPSGIFLIETKNWSKKSWTEQNLRSPVQQIKRSSFALWRFVSNYSFINGMMIKNIPIRNILATANHVPSEEFPYVKVLPVDRLVGYIEYFKPSLTKQQRDHLASYFLRISN